MGTSTIVLIALGTFLLGGFLGIIFTDAMHRRLRKLNSPALRPLKVSVPRFGAPRRITYQARIHGVLECAGEHCGHRRFTEGELFNEIPLPDEGEGAMLGICMPCSLHGVPASHTPKES